MDRHGCSTGLQMFPVVFFGSAGVVSVSTCEFMFTSLLAFSDGRSVPGTPLVCFVSWGDVDAAVLPPRLVAVGEVASILLQSSVFQFFDRLVNMWSVEKVTFLGLVDTYKGWAFWP